MALSTLAGAGIFRAEHFGDDFFPGERGEGERSDEFLGRAGHHHLHVELFLLQAAHQFGGFISGHSAGDAESDLSWLGATFSGPARSIRTFDSQRCQSVAAISAPVLLSSRQFRQFVFEETQCSSSSAMREVLRDRGLSTRRPAADHQLPGAARDDDDIGELAIGCLS